jgi:hypothetical protein
MNPEDNFVFVKLLDTRTGETYDSKAYYLDKGTSSFSPVGLGGTIAPIAIKVGEEWWPIIDET